MSTENPKPTLLAALLCESVLQEKDGTLSAIRIVEQLVITIPKLPEELSGKLSPNFPKAAIPNIVTLQVLVCLKAGDFRGHVEVVMQVISPSGKAGKPQVIGQNEMHQPESGYNMIVELSLAIKRVGLVWIELFVNGEKCARIPLVVRLGEGSAPLPEFEPDSPDSEPSAI